MLRTTNHTQAPTGLISQLLDHPTKDESIAKDWLELYQILKLKEAEAELLVATTKMVVATIEAAV